jgi:hypothetical protein
MRTLILFTACLLRYCQFPPALAWHVYPGRIPTRDLSLVAIRCTPASANGGPSSNFAFSILRRNGRARVERKRRVSPHMGQRLLSSYSHSLTIAVPSMPLRLHGRRSIQIRADPATRALT